MWSLPPLPPPCLPLPGASTLGLVRIPLRSYWSQHDLMRAASASGSSGMAVRLETPINIVIYTAPRFRVSGHVIAVHSHTGVLSRPDVVTLRHVTAAGTPPAPTAHSSLLHDARRPPLLPAGSSVQLVQADSGRHRRPARLLATHHHLHLLATTSSQSPCKRHRASSPPAPALMTARPPRG